MRRASLLLALGSAAALLAFLSSATISAPPPALRAVVGPALAPSVPAPVPDPFPLRRQFLTTDQLDRLTTDPRGPFRKLLKSEFETDVRAASEATRTADGPPRLVAANYRGRYEPGQIRGSADWAIANLTGRPTLLPMDALRVAVTDLTPADGRTAVLFRGKPGGKENPGTFLWVGADRETTAALGWSTRGVEEQDEERFDLGVPASAIATLELTLPAEFLPVMTAGAGRVPGTGPFPAAAGNDRVWRWAFGGLSPVTLVVRRANTPGAAVTASRLATFDLTLGEVRSAFEFTLDSPRGMIREQVFAVDPGVRVTGVECDTLEQWRQEPADGKGPSRLTVTFREPAAGVRVRMRATSPLAPGADTFDCRGVHANGTLPGGDVIDVIVPPECQLSGWAAGDYRPAVTDATPTRGVKVQFTGTLTSNADRTPPTVRVRPAEPEIVTTEAVVWRVRPGRTQLSAVVTAKVLRGPLPRFAFRAAAGYTLESAALVPEDPAVTFDRSGGANDTWVVEPSRAVPTGGTVEVRLEFSGPTGPPAPDPADPDPAAVPIPFPTFTPAAAVERQGTLTVIGDRVGVAARTVLPVTLTPAGLVVTYRGAEPSGVGLFTPVPTRVSVDAIRVGVVGEECEATVIGRADDSPIGALTVFVPHPAGRVQTSGATARPLPEVGVIPLLGASSGWGAVAAAAAVPTGTYWRLTFPRPLTGEFELFTTYPVPAINPSSSQTLPLPVVGGGRGTTEVILSPDLSAAFDVGKSPDGVPLKVRLEPLAARPPNPTTTGQWQLTDARQVNQLDEDGGLAVTLTGRVIAAGGRTLVIPLPTGAAIESARVGGKWVPGVAADPVSLPLPAVPPDGLPFEVRYRLPPPSRLGLLAQYVSPPPELPAGTAVSTRWAFAKGWLPWPTLATADDCDGRTTVRVARGPVLRGFGFGLGGLVLAAGVRLILRGGRRRAAVLAVVVGVCGGVTWLAPLGWLKVVEPPLYLGLAVLLAGFARRPPPAPTPPRPSSRITPAATAAVLVVAVGFGQPEPAEPPATVYVVGTDPPAVYAPQVVLDRLAALASPPLPPVVVTRAEYAGAADDTGVTFAATFTLLCPRDGEHPFALPLSGVRLEAMTLDGEDAFPDASKPDRYAVTVSGAGTHTLTARFAVTPTGTGGEREARFGGPEAHLCRVTFDAGPTGRQPDVITRRGGQTVGEASGRWTAAADHGAGAVVAVRWRGTMGDAGAKPQVSVKEAGVWDATDSGDAGVWGAFAYQIAAGSLDRFAIDVPADLVPTRVLVRSVDPRAGAVGVRGWRTDPQPNGVTRVNVRLQQPADGRVLVLVRAVPVRPLSPTPVLRFPQAAGVPDAERDSVYAVRFPGVRTSGVTVGGAIDFPADAIVKDFPTVPEFAFDKLSPARVVKRAPNSTTELRPTLAPLAPFTPGSGEVVYTAGEWVEVEGAMRTGAKESGFVEFVVPTPIAVRDVRATGLAGWTRAGDRIQAWLAEPAADVLVRWSGSLAATGPTVELPLPRWGTPFTPSEPITVRVRAADGFAVQPADTTGLKAKPGADSELVYTVEGSPTGARFALTPRPPTARRPSDPPPAPPPAIDPPPPANPPAPPEEEPPPPFNPWPVVAASGWVVGLLAAVAFLRGPRWRPERLTAIGLLAAVAAEVGTPLGWAFAAVAGVGLLWRMARVGRGLVA